MKCDAAEIFSLATSVGSSSLELLHDRTARRTMVSLSVNEILATSSWPSSRLVLILLLFFLVLVVLRSCSYCCACSSLLLLAVECDQLVQIVMLLYSPPYVTPGDRVDASEGRIAPGQAVASL